MSSQLIQQSKAIAMLSEKSVDISTGRGSRPEFEVSIQKAPDGQWAATFYLIPVGKNPLRDLHATLSRATQQSGGGANGSSIYDQHFETFSGTHDPLSRMSTQWLTGNAALFFGWFNALNGHWEQTVKLRRVGDHWEWRSVIHNDIPTSDGAKRIRIISDKASSGFPPKERTRPVFPFNAEDVGK